MLDTALAQKRVCPHGTKTNPLRCAIRQTSQQPDSSNALEVEMRSSSLFSLFVAVAVAAGVVEWLQSVGVHVDWVASGAQTQYCGCKRRHHSVLHNSLWFWRRSVAWLSFSDDVSFAVFTNARKSHFNAKPPRQAYCITVRHYWLQFTVDTYIKTALQCQRKTFLLKI